LRLLGARLVLTERAGLDLPSLATSYGSERNVASVSALVETTRIAGDWRRVEPGNERPLDAVELSTAVRTDAGWTFGPLHVGVVVGSPIVRTTSSFAATTWRSAPWVPTDSTGRR
jgi:hypothetical protein